MARRTKKRSFLPVFITLCIFIAAFYIAYPLWSSLWLDWIGDAGRQPEAPPPADSEPNNPPAPPEPRLVRATIAAAGDIMVHDTQLNGAYDADSDSYDFFPSFEVIAPYVQQADLAIANLETTLAGREMRYSSYPMFNTPEAMAAALAATGFDLVCTANNHSLDRGEEGVYRTIEHLEAAGLTAVGTARSPEERDRAPVREVNGIRLAFLAYTFGTNGIPVPAGCEHIVNLIDEQQMEKDIRRAREQKADIVVVAVHWGHEYHTRPSEEQQGLARRLAQMGADIILGSHPHVVQPMEFIDVEAQGRRSLVIYSLGNFISNQHLIPSAIPTEKVEFGLLLAVTVEKDLQTGDTVIREVAYTPTWVNRQWRHRILPVEALTGGRHSFPVSEDEVSRIARVWSEIEEQLVIPVN